MEGPIPSLGAVVQRLLRAFRAPFGCVSTLEDLCQSFELHSSAEDKWLWDAPLSGWLLYHMYGSYIRHIITQNCMSDFTACRSPLSILLPINLYTFLVLNSYVQSYANGKGAPYKLPCLVLSSYFHHMEGAKSWPQCCIDVQTAIHSSWYRSPPVLRENPLHPKKGLLSTGFFVVTSIPNGKFIYMYFSSASTIPG